MPVATRGARRPTKGLMLRLTAGALTMLAAASSSAASTGAGIAAQAAPSATPTAAAAPAQAAPAGGAETAAQTVRLELRVFDGTAEVTSESRVRLFKKGERSQDIALTQAGAPGAAVTATVPVGFYDAQAIRERRSQLSDLRWAESLLIQRYPDEYGRHLEMINFKVGYGGLQIRPAPGAADAARGWTAVAYPVGETVKEAGKAVPAGDDLLLALPGGRYDVKLTMPDKSTQWIRDIEVPSDRTRLKTWSSNAGGPGSR